MLPKHRQIGQRKMCNAVADEGMHRVVPVRRRRTKKTADDRVKKQRPRQVGEAKGALEQLEWFTRDRGRRKSVHGFVDLIVGAQVEQSVVAAANGQ